MKYIKKTTIIEAIQFTEHPINGKLPVDVILQWINQGQEPPIAVHRDGHIFIKALGGSNRAVLGCYIVKDINGVFYPIEQEIFEDTYQNFNQNLD